ncbi:hypothetical protein [Mycobacteroides abscessus]|uniref:hypothetical protein n=1 Tax=Mycobacteroides abscessus TaxID=36809 RepID=UPI001925A0BF|nr:hypothetical protein [Mycobacteroides abscessus]MBL3752918.1 hypothetical protein [Mycobacteroides abscessus subsp. massiliense]
MTIRGDMEAGLLLAGTLSMHLPTDTPAPPTGSDPKSAEMVAAANEIAHIWKSESTIANSSVDQLRDNVKDAVNRIISSDKQGADNVNNSGGGRLI